MNKRTPVTNRVEVPHRPYSQAELDDRRDDQAEQRKMLARRFKVGVVVGAIALTGAVEAVKGIVGALNHQAQAQRIERPIGDAPAPAPAPAPTPDQPHEDR